MIIPQTSLLFLIIFESDPGLISFKILISYPLSIYHEASAYLMYHI
jgi:hypothetical protein